MDPFSQLPKKNKFQKNERAIDLFDQLPKEIIQTILYFLYTEESANKDNLSFYTEESVNKDDFSLSFPDTKEATRTSILSKRFQEAFTTIPDLYFVDVAFNKLLLSTCFDANLNQDQEVAKARERFAIFVDRTLAKYQQCNIPIRKLTLDTRVVDSKTANILEQCIRKAKEHRVKEVCLRISLINAPNLLQAIFALGDQLQILELSGCDLLNDNVQDNVIIKFLSLRMLKLANVKIDQGILQNLIHCCPMIKDIEILKCEGPKTIQVADMPNLKSLHVCTVSDQLTDVKVESLEIMSYQTKHSQYLLSIKSTRNLKELFLSCLKITDEELHNLIAKFPALEKLKLKDCNQLQKITLSSRSLKFLSIVYLPRIIELKLDAPNLNQFDYIGHSESVVLPSLCFADEGCAKRKSCVFIGFEQRAYASLFLELSEFLMKFRPSDHISLHITSDCEEICFDKNSITDEREFIPEFEELMLSVSTAITTIYSTIMDGLLWSFSPKILSVECDIKDVDENFIKYLCEELLVERDSNLSYSSSSKCWRNYFTHAKFEGKDDEWHPLHSWKSLEDAMQNLGDKYILKLSHVEQV